MYVPTFKMFAISMRIYKYMYVKNGWTKTSRRPEWINITMTTVFEDHNDGQKLWQQTQTCIHSHPQVNLIIFSTSHFFLYCKMYGHLFTLECVCVYVSLGYRMHSSLWDQKVVEQKCNKRNRGKSLLLPCYLPAYVM